MTKIRKHREFNDPALRSQKAAAAARATRALKRAMDLKGKLTEHFQRLEEAERARLQAERELEEKRAQLAQEKEEKKKQELLAAIEERDRERKRREAEAAAAAAAASRQISDSTAEAVEQSGVGFGGSSYRRGEG